MARASNTTVKAARARWQQYMAAKRAAAKKAPVKRQGRWLPASGPWRGFLTSAKRVLVIHGCSGNRVRQAAAVGKSRNKRCPKCGAILPEATEMLYMLQKLRG